MDTFGTKVKGHLGACSLEEVEYRREVWLDGENVDITGTIDPEVVVTVNMLPRASTQ